MNLHDETGNLVNFCVPLEGSDEEKRAIAIEVIDKSVEMGAELNEVVEGVSQHQLTEEDPSIWGLVGVDYSLETCFYDVRNSYGNLAKSLTIEEFRDYYDKWKSGQHSIDLLFMDKLKNGDDLKDQIFEDLINPKEDKQSLDYEKLQQLFSTLSSIYNDNTSTWEQKHNKVFGDTLASDICKAGNMKIPPVVSTNHVELSSFYEAVKAKLNYLKYYY